MTEWEDRHVVGFSAPVAVKIKSSPVGDILWLFVVGFDGHINQTVTPEGNKLFWKDLEWRSMSGNMTTNFYRY